MVAEVEKLFINPSLKKGKKQKPKIEFDIIDDNIEATRLIFEKGYFINDVVNIGSNIEVSVLDLAQRIIKMTGSTSKIVHLPALEEGDMTRRQPDNSKMLDILKRPLKNLDEGIEILIKEFKK